MMNARQVIFASILGAGLCGSAFAYTDQTDFLHPLQYKAQSMKFDPALKREFQAALEIECPRVTVSDSNVVCEDQSRCINYMGVSGASPSPCEEWSYTQRWVINPFTFESVEQQKVALPSGKSQYEFTVRDYMRKTSTFVVRSADSVSKLEKALDDAHVKLLSAPNSLYAGHCP